MSGQACEPCSRRKVRCDKQQPCSNCRRRKQDQCVYPEASPSDRIKRLQDLVRKLGGDPDETEDRRPSKRARQDSAPVNARGVERDGSAVAGCEIAHPLMLEADGQSYYIESRAWNPWIGGSQQSGSKDDMTMSRPLLARTKPNALEGITRADFSIEFALRHPSVQDANVLWDNFERNADPLIKLDFDWALKNLRTDSIENRTQLNDAEHALIFSTYSMSVVSMSEEECTRDLHQPKHVLLSQFQTCCEQALARTNILCITDITVIKALVLYMLASIERLSIQSLWSLMGLTIRNAEKLGIHRDGALLGLSPFETESRRRLWWRLQHLDLALAVRSGSTPLTLMAGWDANLPLNIDDDDLRPDTKEPLRERKGLTSLSYCLWTYWVLAEQRDFFASNKAGLSWAFNKSVPHTTKQLLIDRIEQGLNNNFLQYCDPIKPLDTFIQLSARALICGFRMFTLHPMAFSGDPEIDDQERHRRMMAAAVNSLEYNIAANSRPELQRFHWLTEGMFPWQALISVIVETLHQKDVAKSQQTWHLLSNLYASNPSLLRLDQDRRKLHAADLIVAACRARLAADPSAQTPACASVLEPLLVETRAAAQTRAASEVDAPPPLEPVVVDAELDALLDLDFHDID